MFLETSLPEDLHFSYWRLVISLMIHNQNVNKRTWLTLTIIVVLKWDTCSFRTVPHFDVLHHIIYICHNFCLVCFKRSSKKNSLTTHLGMVICTHHLAQIYSKLTQGHFLQTSMSFRKCHFKDHVCLDKSFLSCEKGLTDIQSQTPKGFSSNLFSV